MFRLPVANAAQVVSEAVRRLDADGIALDDLAIHRPTLDDVFLTLTGHRAEVTEADTGTKRKRGTRP